MKRTAVKNCLESLNTVGRTFMDKSKDILYMNWTCSGVEFVFEGTCLMARLQGYKGIEIDGMPFDENAPRRNVWPIIAVFVDGEEQPGRIIHVNKDVETYLLYESEKEEKHTIRLAKLTENLKTRVGIEAFIADGNILPLEQNQKNKKRIEFIGDSITCGFGNMTTDPSRFFYCEDEDGWMSYAALTARKLDMDWQQVCISGICTSLRPSLPQMYGMEDLYPYTDRVQQEADGVQGEPENWDFNGNPSDYVVLSLGTNDANAVLLADDYDGELEIFKKNYRAFIYTIRELNGPDTWIICALGSMDYYLYHDIEMIVDAYKKESGDEHISCFRFKKIRVIDPMGACNHPHVVTHQKMADELVNEIKRIEML